MKAVITDIHDTKLAVLKEQIISTGIKPKLTIVSVGDDPASQIYMRNKVKLLGDAGVEVQRLHMNVATQSQLDDIARESQCPLLFQLPLPDGLEAPDLPKHLDADAFGSEALGKLVLGQADLLPCTVQAVFDIVDNRLGCESYKGLKVAIVGRSVIVGKPLAIEMINRQATVTTFNSRSDLDIDWGKYDVVIVATGFHGVVNSSMFKKGQLVIDVGITRHNGKIVGDVKHDCESSAEITPVPGGVGRLTVLNLLANTVALTR